MTGILRRREGPQSVNREMTRQTQTPDPFQWLAAWDPFRSGGTMNPFHRMSEMIGVDPLAELMSGVPTMSRRFVPDMEVREKSDSYVICADLPGLTEDDVTVEVIGNRLTIRGKREEEQRDESDQYLAYERSYGTFARSFVLPEGSSSDQIDARLDNGVLEVRIPKVKGEESTKIRVQGAGQQQTRGPAPGARPQSQSGAAASVGAGSTQTGTMTSTGQASSQSGAHEKAA
jgi:HSP20 family protein